MRLKSLLLLLPAFYFLACKEKQNSSSAEEKTAVADTVAPQPPGEIDSSATYFSLSDYFKDQWETRRGSPYVLMHITYANGKRDSAHAPLDSTLWFGLRSYFDAADISDKKFLGRYRFDTFDDDATSSRHYHYEALSPDLYTQKLDIATDLVNDKVQSVYVETRRTENGRETSQKLYYAPDNIFQIQETAKGGGRPDKESREEYRYNYN